MNDTVLTRRAALSMIGAGSVVALAACSSSTIIAAEDVNTATASASPTPDQDSATRDYRGEVKFDSYDTPAGEYKPATRTARAQNVPKPTRPQNIDDETIAGLYSTIGFYAAAISYGFITGNPEPFNQVNIDESVKKEVTSSLNIFKQVWFEDVKVTFTLESAQPIETDGVYSWPVTMNMSFGTYVVYYGTAVDLPHDKQRNEMEGIFSAQYDNGAWKILGAGEGFGSVTDGMNV